ncbi:MAG: hypothetical protein LBL91_00290 [Lachnospiraceae bacterium]|jgi:hypothetical protein|nr:hypothetical protein [Lachnospiraceae bacterium]
MEEKIKMKIYISHSSKYDYKNKIYNPIKNASLSKSNKFFFPHEQDSNMVNAKEIISSYDLVIAEVSLPSTGQGIELGWAEYTKTPILCIYEKNAEISSSLHLITDNFIEYGSSEDMIDKISNFIEKLT